MTDSKPKQSKLKIQLDLKESIVQVVLFLEKSKEWINKSGCCHSRNRGNKLEFHETNLKEINHNPVSSFILSQPVMVRKVSRKQITPNFNPTIPNLSATEARTIHHHPAAAGHGPQPILLIPKLLLLILLQSLKQGAAR